MELSELMARLDEVVWLRQLVIVVVAALIALTTGLRFRCPGWIPGDGDAGN